MNNPIYNIIIDILGQPKKYNKVTLQGQWNCIHTCLTENNDIPDSKGNLEISFSKMVFHCWKCEWSGSLKKLIKRYGSKFHLKQYDNLVDYDDNNQDKKIIKQELIYLPKEYISFKNGNKKDIAYKEAYNYLISRGLDLETIYKYEMGYCPEGKYSNRIIILSYDKNNKLNYFIARSYIGHKIKYKNPTLAKQNIIINEKNINWDSTIFLVEGVFDMIGLYPLTNVIPLIGKVMSEHLYHTLIKKSKGFICLILDGDAKNDAYQIYKKLQTSTLKGKIRIVDLPNGSDLSIIRKDFGKEGIREILKTNRRLKLNDFVKYNI